MENKKSFFEKMLSEKNISDSKFDAMVNNSERKVYRRVNIKIFLSEISTWLSLSLGTLSLMVFSSVFFLNNQIQSKNKMIDYIDKTIEEIRYEDIELIQFKDMEREIVEIGLL